MGISLQPSSKSLLQHLEPFAEFAKHNNWFPGSIARAGGGLSELA